MGHKADTDNAPSRTIFVRELRKILPNLYNPALVRSSPLIQVFGLETRRDAPAALQRLVTEAIEALEPGADVPVGSTAWRVYQVLHTRYIDQFSQEEVARDLFLSPRQLRRQEQSAVEILADHLWAVHNLDQLADQLKGSPESADGEAQLEDSGPSGQDEELAWLERTLSSQVVDCNELIQAALNTARPLIESLHAAVDFEPPDRLPKLAIQQASARQALLHVILLAARFAGSGQVAIRAEVLPFRLFVRLRITAQPLTPAAALLNEPERVDLEGLEVARKLIQLSKGAFEARTEPGKTPPFSVVISLPTAEQIPILVIDDNVDTLRLVERYLSATRYRFVGVSNPQDALDLVERITPGAIVMDVMLPDMDGWDLLGRLREHPATRSIPVIVCTILPQAELALMLGAAEFVNKPIRREALVSALDRLVDLASPESG